MKKEARLYEPLPGGKVQCNVCPRRCKIPPGKRGFCQTRENINGKIYTLVYGSLSSEAVDPIEKKPLFNFWPGSRIYSVATVGCSFACSQCQNWQISQAKPTKDGKAAIIEDGHTSWRGGKFSLKTVMPEELIARVEKSGSRSIAYTYNEPLIWHEYLLDSARLAHEHDLKTVLVTNGYSTPEATDELAPHIDAANIDIKAFSDEFYRQVCKVPSVQPVLDTAVRIQEYGVFLELTTLIIPGLNDSREEIGELVQWVLDNLGADTPIHFSAFHPDYKMKDRPRTNAKLLTLAWDTARDMGMQYVYVGNVRSKDGEHTYCPQCGAVVVERHGYALTRTHLAKDNHCAECGAEVNIQGQVIKRNGFFG